MFLEKDTMLSIKDTMTMNNYNVDDLEYFVGITMLEFNILVDKITLQTFVVHCQFPQLFSFLCWNSNVN